LIRADINNQVADDLFEPLAAKAVRKCGFRNRNARMIK